MPASARALMQAACWREDDVIEGNRQEFGLAVGEPLPLRRSLALRAIAVAAGVVGDARARAVLVRSLLP